MRSVERVKQGELRAIIFQELLIKIIELDLQTASPECVIGFVLDYFLGFQHGVERLQVVLPFRVAGVEVGGSLRFERNGAGLVEGGLCGLCGLGGVEAESVLRVFGGEGVLSNGAVPD
jgi:hypothetical protein